MAPKVAIIIYTMYGHIGKMAEAVKAGVAAAGGNATIYQIPETLPQEVLTKMHAPSKPEFPIIDAKTMATFDGLIFGFRRSHLWHPHTLWQFPWAMEGGLWASGGLSKKFCSVFVSTGTPGGGQEMTVANAMSTFVHHGMIFVPLGYAKTFAQLSNLNEVRGGSPWGAGTFAGGDGSRQPSPLELEVAEIQGKQFWEIVSKYQF